MTTQLLKEAIRAIKAGDKQAGKRKLYQVIKSAPQSREAEQAWLWMTRVVSDPKQKIQCLETALELNPDNQSAQKGLLILQQKLAGKTATQQASKRPPSSPHAAQSITEQTAAETDGVSSEPIDSSAADNLITIDLTKLEAPLILGVLGSLLLVLGVFTPIFSMPIVGQLNLLYEGNMVGIALLIAAIVILILTIAKQYQWVWSLGLPALTAVGSVLFFLLNLIANLRQATQRTNTDALDSALADAFTGMLLEAVKLEWGWIILFFAILLIIATPILHPPSRKAPIPIILGIALSAGTFAALFLARDTPADFSLNNTDDAGTTLFDLGEDTAPETESQSAPLIPSGQPVTYAGNTLRVLQMHNPTGFAVVEGSLFGYEPVPSIAGTRFVTIEFEFTCGSEEDVICDSVPEASLKLLLADGKQVSSEWQILDADNLGEEDIASGKSTAGWVSFRVPDDTPVSELIVDPFGGSALRAALPASQNGIQLTHAWEQYDTEMDTKIEPRLRQGLQEEGIATGYLFHMRSSDGQNLAIDICAETTYSFGRDEIIQNHNRIILDALEIAAPYTSSNENVGLIFNECEDTPVFGFTIIATYDSLMQWSQRRLNDSDFLDRLYVSEE